MGEQVLRLYRQGEDGELVPWDFVVEGNVIIREEKVEGAFATPQEEAKLPRATQLQLADWRARGIKYAIKDGRPHVVSIPVVETLLNRFFNEKEPCFFDGCEELRQQWKEFQNAALEADPTCDMSCTNNKIKRQFREKIRPILQQHEHDITAAKQVPAPQAAV